mmetsp:Transcript_8480/g.31916  ORF Transcript_8480/g.31916 Transcript_8480/m.31916 type:complete len:250 (-) Transcript_8480:955-1704(-)
MYSSCFQLIGLVGHVAENAAEVGAEGRGPCTAGMVLAVDDAGRAQEPRAGVLEDSERAGLHDLPGGAALGDANFGGDLLDDLLPGLEDHDALLSRRPEALHVVRDAPRAFIVQALEDVLAPEVHAVLDDEVLDQEQLGHGVAQQVAEVAAVHGHEQLLAALVVEEREAVLVHAAHLAPLVRVRVEARLLRVRNAQQPKILYNAVAVAVEAEAAPPREQGMDEKDAGARPAVLEDVGLQRAEALGGSDHT